MTGTPAGGLAARLMRSSGSAASANHFRSSANRGSLAHIILQTIHWPSVQQRVLGGLAFTPVSGGFSKTKVGDFTA